MIGITPIYQPRRPRASPLWQLIPHGWGAFRTRLNLPDGKLGAIAAVHTSGFNIHDGGEKPVPAHDSSEQCPDKSSHQFLQG